jgi:diguanylate cyclase (GGDEF)-like protein
MTARPPTALEPVGHHTALERSPWLISEPNNTPESAGTERSGGTKALTAASVVGVSIASAAAAGIAAGGVAALIAAAGALTSGALTYRRRSPAGPLSTGTGRGLMLDARAGSEGAFVWDRTTGRVRMSATAAELLGLQGTDGRNWLENVSPEERPKLNQQLNDFVNGRQSALEASFVVLVDDERRWLQISASARRDGRLVALKIGGWLADSTMQRETETQLRHEALHDALTGLPNRAKLLHDLDHAIARRRHDAGFGYAVLFLDVDGFKLVNDSQGHHAGDTLLRELGERLRETVPPPSLVARVSGDEFLVLVHGSSNPRVLEQQAQQIATDISAALARRLAIAGREWQMNSSVGIVIGGAGYRVADEVLRDADIAMYAAKTEGRGGYKTFDQSMRDEVFRRLDLERDIRLAMDSDSFVLHYQPIIDLNTRRFVGVEALVRMKRADGELVPPGSFIELAEQTGLIVPLTNWIIRRALDDLMLLRSLDDRVVGLWLNINVSARCFESDGLVEYLTNEVKLRRLPMDAVRVEITESVLIEGATKAQKAVEQLIAQGIALVLDDFGTGYSSLSYLHRFAFSGLKIDRSFIARFPDRSSVEVVETILALARQLHLKVTAEGIEQLEQARVLVAMGCEYGQGYGLGRPMPMDNLSTWTLQYLLSPA